MEPAWAGHLCRAGPPEFRSPYQGANRLTPARNAEETVDLTLFAGVRLWQRAAFYVNPEVDQGFGLSDTLSVAGFPSGEAYNVGKWHPYVRLQRAFLRQRIDLGGDSNAISPGADGQWKFDLDDHRYALTALGRQG